MSTQPLIHGLTKGQTLQKLSPKLEGLIFSVPETHILNVSDWMRNQANYNKVLDNKFGTSSLVVAHLLLMRMCEFGKGG